MTAQRWQTETYYTSGEMRELMFASLVDSRDRDGLTRGEDANGTRALRPAPVGATTRRDDPAPGTTRGTVRPGQPGVPTCSTGAALPVLSLAPRSAPVEPDDVWLVAQAPGEQPCIGEDASSNLAQPEPTYTLPDHCTECGRWRGPDPEAA